MVRAPILVALAGRLVVQPAVDHRARAALALTVGTALAAARVAGHRVRAATSTTGKERRDVPKVVLVRLDPEVPAARRGVLRPTAVPMAGLRMVVRRDRVPGDPLVVAAMGPVATESGQLRVVEVARAGPAPIAAIGPAGRGLLPRVREGAPHAATLVRTLASSAPRPVESSVAARLVRAQNVVGPNARDRRGGTSIAVVPVAVVLVAAVPGVDDPPTGGPNGGPRVGRPVSR